MTFNSWPFLVLLEGYARQIPNSYRQEKEWMDSHAHEVEVLLLKHYAPACSSLKDVVLVVDNSGFKASVCGCCRLRYRKHCLSDFGGTMMLLPPNTINSRFWRKCLK